MDAATRLFLERGFEATSCDEVASLAAAGKASIYARYANKEALFAAVVRRGIERMSSSSGRAPGDRPLPERLRAVGDDILRQALDPQAVAMMRLAIATTSRFPELARLADEAGREAAIRRFADAIIGRAPDRDAAIRQAMPAAALLADMVLAPFQMRALLSIIPESGPHFPDKNDAATRGSKQVCVGRPTQTCLGEEEAMLRAQATQRVADAVSVLIESGRLSGWD